MGVDSNQVRMLTEAYHTETSRNATQRDAIQATLLGQREKYSPPAPLPRTFSPTRARDTEKEAEALKERFAHLQSKLYSPTEVKM